MTETTNISTVADHAAYLAAHGLAVFPLRQNDKRPATEHGFHDASSDPGVVRSWWELSPTCNVGVATGSGIAVIDVDVDEGKGEDGLTALRDWERDHGEMPETFTVVTGRGGLHLYYRVDREVRCSTNAELGIDVRGDGGYVVGPGSTHPNGRTYEMQDYLEDVPIADADDSVYALIDHVQAPKA